MDRDEVQACGEQMRDYHKIIDYWMEVQIDTIPSTAAVKGTLTNVAAQLKTCTSCSGSAIKACDQVKADIQEAEKALQP
ncbi:MAG: hypothetical protein KME45_03090 [Stenomitos rutilans HA7619-LM2]|jgi:hypothetical protein|nr:hypothetical protein [Stenomitos rutilans HA7619-LM2]MBW4469370.1 hypothetical protein [Stenomitos rutilans HA7619-LM2]